MNLYYELMQYPVFSIAELKKYYSNEESARTALKKLVREGLVAKIRNNMYTCMNGETREPVANRFQIGCAVSSSAYISHHSAMEFYGLADQIYYDVYVLSETQFNEFSFWNYDYHYLKSRCPKGIVTPALGGGVRITDLERTVVDCLKDMDAIAGVEETLSDIAAVSRLSEDKLLEYLECYGNQFLYQKTGYVLWHHRERLHLSDEFFEACKSRIGKSKRYFTKDDQSGRYDSEWKLVVPERVFDLKNGEPDAYI